MESLQERTKKQIFKEAKRASDDLVFWNHPNQKARLTPWDQWELEFKLWKDNRLDRLIYNRLGSDGWNNYQSKKFRDDDFDTLIMETKNLRLFLNTLTKK